ncbi:MAG: hypothetical protein KatS3mg110_2002 [Pirellulaceae bacterium]|nr:MAG: hypothetical protein KatS3mg110_2002 [Pirellulaceae bacterium]
MRTTVRVDDDAMAELKRRAQAENSSLTRLVKQLLRLGREASPQTRRKRRFRQTTYAVGRPRMDLTKATALAAALEHEEILPKLALHQ